MNIPMNDLNDLTAFCDPAAGKKPNQVKKVRARSAIVVVGQDDFQRIFVLKAWGQRCRTDELVEEIMKTSETWSPKVFGIEANAMQSLFADCVQRESKMRGLVLPIRPILQPTKVDKIYRIRSALQPVISEGRLFIQEDQHELKQEILTFPMSPTVDIIDALASAVALLPKRNKNFSQIESQDSYEQYLRDTHAPEWYIARERQKTFAWNKNSRELLGS